MTNDISSALAELTPEQRRLLSIRLREARSQRRQPPPAPPRTASDQLPLSFTQEQLWFLDRWDPGTPVYNVPFALRLRGPLDPESLRSALNGVVTRHDALRVVFTEADGSPRQVVRARVDVPLPLVDLRPLPAAERMGAMEREAAAHGRISFDLRIGPLLAVRLLALEDEDHLLLVTVHHIVFDAWSAEIFTNDLVAYYGHFAAGEPLALPALDDRYAEYTHGQREPSALANVTTQVTHWRDRLAGAPGTSTVPPDRPRPAVQTHHGGRRIFTLTAPLTRQLTDLARDLGVTLNSVVVAGFAALLRQATGQDDLLFGMPAASRPRVELEPLIGSFANMLVLRIDTSDDPTVGELIKRVHQTVGDAYRHQDAPYARVVEEVAPVRDPGLNPLFQVMVTVAHGDTPERSAADVVFASEPVDNQLTDFDLFTTVTRHQDECEVVLDYNADLYLAETADLLADRLTSVLTAMTAGPGSRVGTVDALRRRTVALAATFTGDPVRAPMQLWLDLLRVPAGVACVRYGQMIPHLLAGGDEAATVCLLRWEDWLRHADISGGPAAVAGLLDASMRDLESAVRIYRKRSAAELVLQVCPSSARFQDWAWSRLFARLDDRLAQLAIQVDGVQIGWAVEESDRYPVAEPHDSRADELGHVPYSAEYFAVLGTLAARQLWRASGRTARLVVADPDRLGCGQELARLLPHLRVVSCPATQIVDRLGSLLAADGVAPEACVVLDPDRALISVVRERHPRVVAIVAAEQYQELRRSLAHLWVLDRPAGDVRDGLFTAMGPDLAGYLAEQLADPAAIADRVAVRGRSGTGDEQALVAPRNVTEERLAALWREVLQVDEVGTTADFFMLGGHSLLATQLLSRIQRELGREVSLYTLFTNPTICGLAAVLDEAGETAAEPLLPAPPTAEPVASSIQQRLWALAQIDEEDARHNTTLAAALHGELHEAALRQAVEEVVRRHEVLRTTFVERRGRPVPVVHHDVTAWVEPVDLAEPAGADRDAAVRAHIERLVAHRYDLTTGPLLRVQLLRAAPDEHYLLVGMHHIVCDNTSWRIFLDELAAAYDAFRVGLPAPLPPLLLQFGDFAHHQQEWLAGGEVATHLAYWRDKLRDAPAPLELAGDRPGSATGSDGAGRHAQALPDDVGRAMREFSRAAGVTPFSVVLAAFAVLLYQESGEADMVVGMPTHGRDRTELEALIGCFADLLPLRLDVAGRPTFRRLVRRLHATVKEAHAHQRLSFPKIMEALRLPRDASRHPLKCVLNYTDLADEPPNLPGLRVVPLPVGAPGADFDLLLTVDWQGQHLQAELTYRADQFSAEWAARLTSAFGHMLAELLARPDESIGEPTRFAPRTVPPDHVNRSQAVVLAASFPIDRILATLRFWSSLLPEPALSVTAAPDAQLLRPLLDCAGPLGADDDALNVVLLRWEDWLAGADLTTTRALPAAVLVLERALFDLCQAVSVFRARSDATLLIGVCPASPRWSEPPWAGVLSGLTDRLHRFCVRHKDVQVVPMDPWAQRYGVAEPCGDLAAHQEPLRYTTEFDAAVATVVARRARRGRHPALASVVLDPGRFPATAALTRFVRDQVRCGRDVTLTSEPTSPELASLVTSGPVRVAAAGDAVSQLGELVASGVIEPETTLALDPDPAVGAALREFWPRIHAVTVPSGEAPDDFAGHLWVLDRPVTGAPDDPAAEIPHDLLADIATELNTADRIWSAVQAGYRRPAQRESAVPRTEREQILAAIWADVLQLDEVGVHDDFYGLGGDSLLTIMAAFRAGEAGIELTARQITQHRTIAALAAVVGRQTHDAEPQIADDGDMPLTPAQLWWCETVAPTMARPALFNHPYYLELRRPVSAGHLAEAIGLLAAHHDALRLRFRRDAAGIWRQYHALPADAVPFASHDLSGLPAGEQDEAMLSLATAEQLGLDIANGPTCRVVHFRLGSDRPDRLLIVAHHLVVDAVSRELLLSDLQTLCGQLGRAEVPRLPAKTTSYRTWAVRLTDQATIERVRAELPFWLDQRAEDGDTLPPDHPGGVTTLGSTSSVDATLSVQATVALHDVARRMRVSVRDLLVWGVAQAVTARTGRSECAIATTGHGREDLFDDVDVSRTVGWFQVLYPLRLRLGAGDGGAGSVAEVAEQLARVPNNGIGYGQLRFGCPDPDVRQRLAQVPAPRIAVNYMGGFGFDDAVQTAELFEVCAAPYGPTEDGSGAWPFDLDVVGTLVGGRLRIEVGYGTAVYRRASAEGLLTDLHSRLVNLASVTGRRSAMTP